MAAPGETPCPLHDVRPSGWTVAALLVNPADRTLSRGIVTLAAKAIASAAGASTRAKWRSTTCERARSRCTRVAWSGVSETAPSILSITSESRLAERGSCNACRSNEQPPARAKTRSKSWGGGDSRHHEPPKSVESIGNLATSGTWLDTCSGASDAETVLGALQLADRRRRRE